MKMMMKMTVLMAAAFVAGLSLLAAGDAARNESEAMNRAPDAFKTVQDGEKGGARALILGNSIAYHRSLPSIGWTNDWGMAASAREKDFAHLFVRGLERRIGRPVEARIKNIAELERNHRGVDVTKALAEEIAFHPDYLVIAIGENVEDLDADERRKDYGKFFSDLVESFVRGGGDRPKAVVRGVFWKNAAKDAVMREVAEKHGIPFVCVDFDSEPGMRAGRRFAHPGVAAHPGDRAMAEIARRLLLALGDGGEESDAHVYPVPNCEERHAAGYAVTVGGREAPVSAVRHSAMPVNIRWPGHQRELDQTEIDGMVRCAVSGRTRIVVTAPRDFKEVKVRPLAKGIAPRTEGRRIAFDIPGPGFYSVEFDGIHRNLHLFVDPPVDCRVDKSVNTIYYGPGAHDVGVIELKSGQTLFIDEGAVVFGRVYARDADNIAIRGRGILDMSRIRERPIDIDPKLAEEQRKKGFAITNAERWDAVRLEFCDNVTIDGVTIRDSLCYNIRPVCCRNLAIRNVKICGNWRYNSDGIDMHNCENVRISDCFIRTFDDAICVKGFDYTMDESEMLHDGYRHDVFTNAVIERCTVWCDWGRALEFGAETRAREIADITFRDCDVIRAADAACEVQNCDYADIHGILFDDIRIELDSFPHKAVFSASAKDFNPGARGRDPLVFGSVIHVIAEYSKGDVRRGRNRDITLRNIRVTGGSRPRFCIRDYDADHRTTGLVLDGVYWNGCEISSELKASELRGAIANDGKIRVACIGDSITWGFAMTNRVAECYPAQLQRLLGPDYDVRNFGDPGSGVYSHPKADPRGWTEHAWRTGKNGAAAYAFEPDIVVCNLGINDSGSYLYEFTYDQKGSPKTEPGLFRREYEELLRAFGKDGKSPRVIMWTRLGPLGKGHPAKGSPNPFVMERDLRAVAESVGAEQLDMYTPLLPYAETPDFADDGVHPEGGAQRVIAEITAKRILRAMPDRIGELSSAQWMWYPGDFEIYLAQEVQEERLEWGGVTPIMWPQYHHYPIVTFTKEVELAKDESVEVWVDGAGSFRIPDVASGSFTDRHMSFRLPKGRRLIQFVIVNSKRLPSVRVKGESFVSDATWRCHHSNVRASEVGVGTAAYLADGAVPPSDFRLATEPMDAVSQRKTARGGTLVDFGRETMGYVRLHGVKGRGRVKVIYGESEKEALLDGLGDDRIGQKTTSADVWEFLDLAPCDCLELKRSRAFRYVNVVPVEGNASVERISMLREFNSVETKGAFACDDEELNRIWRVGAETLRLTTREFLVDGIKRDRWIWSGDAYQSSLMGYYLFGDQAAVARTLWALRGKDPVWCHINTIADYTFYWFNMIGDYYLFTGDAALLRQIYPRMVSMMDFVEGRLRPDGLYEARSPDWVFIDWAPKRLENYEGPVAAEQILLARAYAALSQAAAFVGDEAASAKYAERGRRIRERVKPLFWDDAKGGLVHALDRDLKPLPQFARYANIFGILYGYFDDVERKTVMEKCIRNPDVMRIQTPYMRFYELEALCALGLQEDVMREMRSYWGGMLRLGATSFWELYNPDEKGDAHYAMYGRPFGKSLCHAWGASPIYLLGRYYLGVEPVAPGFAKYTVRPALGGLKWMTGRVPTPSGEIEVEVRDGKVRVKGNAGTGTLLWRGKSCPIAPNATVEVF